jgi:SAM-dependent methyltransferase
MELRAGYIFGNEAYLESGRAIAAGIQGMLRASGATEPADILEWGFSTGRVLRHWRDLAPSARLWGCDIDAEAIGWGWGNLWPPVRVFQCSPAARIALPDDSMDLVYGISVFTHIATEPEAWLMELRRITRPGGHVFVSINDEHVWARCGREPDFHIAKLCPRLDFSRPMEDDFVAQGLGIHAQSFWRTDAVRRRWSAFFEVVEIRPRMIDAVQAGVLLRRA